MAINFCKYKISFLKKQLCQHPRHPLNGSFLFLKSRMYVQIHCSSQRRMAENDRNRLVVALALDTPGRKTMAKRMKPGKRNAQCCEQFSEIIPIVAGLQWGGCIGDDIEIVGHNLAKGPDNLQDILAYRNIPDRRCRLRLANRQSVFLLVAIGKPDSLDSLCDMNLPGGNIQILPLQSTDFSDA